MLFWNLYTRVILWLSIAYIGTVQAIAGKKVDHIDIIVKAEDVTGDINLTDLQFQDGMWSTGYVPASEEMLKRETDGPGIVILTRHTNVVIRGKKTINVPNWSSGDTEQILQNRVTGGMGFKFEATSAVPGNVLQYSHEYRTRTFILHEPLNPGDVFDFYAHTRTVTINGVKTGNYFGFYHTCPGRMGRFNVEATTGLLLCEPDAWLKGIGGERM